MNSLLSSTRSTPHARDFTMISRLLTLRCWNSQVRMAVVAVFGKIPRFFCLCLPPILSSPSSSLVPSPDPMLLSMPSPEMRGSRGWYKHQHLLFDRFDSGSGIISWNIPELSYCDRLTGSCELVLSEPSHWRTARSTICTSILCWLLKMG